MACFWLLTRPPGAQDRDYWQHRSSMESKAKDAAFAAAHEFEKAAVAAEKAPPRVLALPPARRPHLVWQEIEHWKGVASSSHSNLATAIEQAST